MLGGRTRGWLAAGAAAWVAIVAVMTIAGYAGNPRYLVAAAAARRRARRRGSGPRRERAGRARAPRARPLAARSGPPSLVAAVLAITAGDLRDQFRSSLARAEAAAASTACSPQPGGADALLRCSRIRTSIRARSLVAWRLDLPLRDLDARPVRPAVVIRAKWFYGHGLEPPRQPGYRRS